MLSPRVAKYLPHMGLLCLFLGVIFAIISVIEYPKDNSIKIGSEIKNVLKFQQLSTAFVLVGGFLLVGPFNSKE